MRILDALFFLPVTLALLVVVVFVSPSWRWVAGFVTLVSGFFAYFWAEHWLASQTPGYTEGPGGFGIGLFAAAAQAWVMAVVIYVAGFAWWRVIADGKST